MKKENEENRLILDKAYKALKVIFWVDMLTFGIFTKRLDRHGDKVLRLAIEALNVNI